MNRQRFKPLQRQLAAGLLALALLGATFQGWQLQADHVGNAQVAALLAGQDRPIGRPQSQPVPVLAARALYLAQHGREDEAKSLWELLDTLGEHEDRAQASHNLGTFYLKAALGKIEAGESEPAIPLAALAKQAFRRALQWQPDLWDAKFNLEIAMRLLPDMDKVGNGQEDEPPETQPKALWTKVPGFPRGQP